MTDKELINYLSQDHAFGILTRPALEIYLAQNPMKYLFCVDFDNIHEMNEKYGYLAVNRIFYNIFDTIKLNYGKRMVIGRVFSGDEIAINCGEDLSAFIIQTLARICKQKKVGFKYVKSEIKELTNPRDSSKLLDGLTTQLRENPQYYSLKKL